MSLYRYRKIENTEKKPKEYIEINKDDSFKSRTNIWEGATESYSLLQKLVNSSLLANLIIPSFFVALGIFFIFQYFYPEIQHQIQKQNGLIAQGTTTLASSDYIDRSTYISNPAGLLDLATQALKQDTFVDDSESRNYKGTFEITIPSLGIYSLPVQANVDSTTETVYNQVLKSSLAHFESTGLPISENVNNIVIYGHSASPNYNPQASDPEVAFSFLPNLKVGDEIIITMEGEEYKYRMYKSKIVEPTDLSVITGEGNRETLTLFTCYPAGNNKSRYVAIARPV
jgi:LPXTG-site transpeptidase (sortase) family protein